MYKSKCTRLHRYKLHEL